MFLKRLVLENVRSLESLDLPFVGADGKVRSWTFLLGQNGTGKSTALQATALLMAGSEALADLLIDVDSWIRNGAKTARIAGELTTAAGEHREIEITLQRGDSIRKVFERNKKTLDDLDRALAHSSRNYLTLGYGVSRRPAEEASNGSRMGSDVGGQFRQVRARGVATLFSPNAILNPLQTWAMDLHYRRGKGGLDTVRKSLQGLLPNVEFASIDKENRQLLFQTPDGEVPFEALSDGYQNVVAWIGDLLYRVTEIFENYKDPLTARGLLLIDEIGLHLHPLWQRHLVRFIGEKLPNFQIFCTTHSPLTVHQAGAGELFFLERETAGKTRRPILHHYEGAPRTLLLHQLLTSPMFGLDSPDSLPVEDLKEEYRNLKKKKSRSAVEEKRIASIHDQLLDLPEWDRGSDEEQRIATALEEINRRMQAAS